MRLPPLLRFALFLVPLFPALAQPGRLPCPAPGVEFTDVTARAGVEFHHANGASPRKYIIETMGSGGAWLDYDGDGWLDLFLVNGGVTPAFQPAAPPRHALFRNLGNGTFRRIGSAAGLEGNGSFGMGAAAADFDNDGYPDLYVTGYPRSTLYRNRGDGTFEDITAKAGVANAGGFASSAGWFDYDRDGRLDLLVLNYLRWSYETDKPCGTPGGMRQYCHPENYEGVSPVLYRNHGDGTFRDVTKKAGLENPDGKGLGLVLADFNGDGWPDVFIANDGIRNFLYLNRGDGTFEDATYSSGVAFSEDGQAEAGMGTDAADFMRQGWLGIYVTHLEFQWNRLYRYLGEGLFADHTREAGLASGRNLFSGFGTRFLDYDNDGWSDLLIANGHILDNIQRIHPDVEYAEPALMLRNLGGGRFRDVTPCLGPALQVKQVGRGLLVADYDNDGDMDAAFTNNGGAARLLENRGGNRAGWIGFRLIGVRSNRDAVGARVTVKVGSATLMDESKGGASYLSTGDPRLFFGLGEAAKVDDVRIRWSSGAVETLGELPGRKIYVVKEGLGVQGAASGR